jgi:hypothetical protein
MNNLDTLLSISRSFHLRPFGYQVHIMLLEYSSIWLVDSLSKHVLWGQRDVVTPRHLKRPLIDSWNELVLDDLTILLPIFSILHTAPELNHQRLDER